VEKAKKAIFYGLIVASASSAILMPTLAEAGFFSLSSLLNATALNSSAAASTYNSQNLPLPSPARNVDPSSKNGGHVLAVVEGSALLADSGPTGTEADISEKPASSQISVYTVHAGDTIASIAKMFNVSANTIVWANDIKGGTVHEGQVLVVLPITGLKHTVTKGETLASLATKYGSTVHEIALYNDLSEAGGVTVGQTVIIPDGELGGSSAGTSVATSGSTSATKSATTKSAPKNNKNAKPSMIQLALQGKQTAPLHGAGGPNLDSAFQWPLDGGIITQGLHGFNAVDIGAPVGTEVYAADDGTVLIALSNYGWNGGYGNYVVIQHANGAQTLYAHLSKVSVSSGDTVGQGDLIGRVGKTGEATGPHLHFEVRGAHNPFGDVKVGGSE
jgi:murein DD-endopeptidase MepM/ murein hydrolase activator NlpD